jgi:hypothetical protein
MIIGKSSLSVFYQLYLEHSYLRGKPGYIYIYKNLNNPSDVNRYLETPLKSEELER